MRLLFLQIASSRALANLGGDMHASAAHILDHRCLDLAFRQEGEYFEGTGGEVSCQLVGAYQITQRIKGGAESPPFR